MCPLSEKCIPLTIFLLFQLICQMRNKRVAQSIRSFTWFIMSFTYSILQGTILMTQNVQKSKKTGAVTNSMSLYRNIFDRFSWCETTSQIATHHGHSVLAIIIYICRYPVIGFGVTIEGLLWYAQPEKGCSCHMCIFCKLLNRSSN